MSTLAFFQVSKEIKAFVEIISYSLFIYSFVPFRAGNLQLLGYIFNLEFHKRHTLKSSDCSASLAPPVSHFQIHNQIQI